MEQLIRKFVWGSRDGKPGLALLPWSTVQKSIDEGGLGFKDLYQQNKAFIMKIGFGLITNNSSLWVRVLKAKYKWEGVMPLSISWVSYSRFWSGVSAIWDELKECVTWDIRNGWSTDFWESIERIASVQPPRSDSGEDQLFWRWESNGQFSARSAYGYLISDTASGIDRIWRKIWKLKVPHRVRMFAWLFWHERLLTNAERVRRHMTTSAQCEICGCRREDMDHVLRQCVAAREVWCKIVPIAERDRFSRVAHREWLRTNLFDVSSTVGDEDWHVRFIITCWLLWKRRCCFVFESARGIGEDIIARGNVLVEEARRAFYVNIDTGGSAMEEVCWLRPPIGWIKVNVDAAVSTVEGLVGIGAVFRDDGGSWLFGFARFVGRCTVLVAELWAIHDGLAQAWGCGHRCVELESDNLEAVRMVNSNSNLLHEQGLFWQ
ncbi:hypothetical protein GQ457_06G011460 [Hibiscus cannabinus]